VDTARSSIPVCCNTAAAQQLPSPLTRYRHGLTRIATGLNPQVVDASWEVTRPDPGSQRQVRVRVAGLSGWMCRCTRRFECNMVEPSYCVYIHEMPGLIYFDNITLAPLRLFIALDHLLRLQNLGNIAQTGPKRCIDPRTQCHLGAKCLRGSVVLEVIHSQPSF
jgi:hypothetical protein